MRLHRFIIPFDSTASELVFHDKELLHQIATVFRMKRGDRFIVCDGNKQEASVEIKEIGERMVVSVLERAESKAEPKREVVLYCALLKRENFEMVVQKSTEVGVTQIVPIITRRTIKQSMHRERLEKIAKEAAEQSGRGVVPTVSDAMQFSALLGGLDTLRGVWVCFDPDGEPVGQWLAHGVPTGAIRLCIGPEGGFDDDEISELKRRGVVVISLGARTLRAETAAIVATYLLAGDIAS